MRKELALVTFIVTCLQVVNAQTPQPYSKPSLVDYDGFETLVKDVKSHRAERLLTLNQFLAKSKEANTIILDARSKEMYNLKHIKGAIHLDFSDFTQARLDAIMMRYAGTETNILIYCNNNFEDKLKPDLQDKAFMTKAFIPRITDGSITSSKSTLTLALNICTYLNLYGYGFKNVYELSELVDVNDPRIQFGGGR
jgi:Rhodanese-like domain